ncbi:MAG: 30S ribosomal protein S6 [Holosporaceae bacterium]|jgi:small subunit ribosomal protein S6|nr:30S ribosomal protein S6 [Holosporaceae bacterium]
MSLYENVFIGRQDLSQQQIEALGAGLGLFVTQNSGEVVRSEYCGSRNLAYPIKKNHKGHYYVMQIKVSAETVAELERIMRINDDIIRHLVVRVSKFDDKDNLITQMKTSNDDFAASRDSGYRHSSNRTNVAESGAVVAAEAEEVSA